MTAFFVKKKKIKDVADNKKLKGERKQITSEMPTW